MSSPDSPLVDSFGRVVDNLRLSVTDRCNFRCVYCMPEEGVSWLPRADILTFEELETVTRTFVSLGVRRVRLTGGEPLVRADLDHLVERLAAIEGLEDLSLTTNGVGLARLAPRLAAAGLKRVNLSLDSLVRSVFQKIARRDALDEVLCGLESAVCHFDGPLKINAVLVRGLNDGEIPAFVELARRPEIEVRFIEFMPLDAQGEWNLDQIVRGEEIRQRIESLHALVPDPSQDPHAPSRDWVFADGQGGKIGFIDPVTSPFCESCNRVRLTADGKLRTCLFSVKETDLRSILRDPSHTADVPSRLAETIRQAVWNKEPGHRIAKEGFVPASRSMSQIGG